MIGICTDSSSQLPPELARRFSVEVVPLTVTVGGVDHLEGVDLDADGFYGLLAADPPPAVSTAAPSPGRFLQAYRRLVAAGAREILSIHVGGAVSATLDAARVAAREADVEVRHVDTGAASFVVGCAVWEAATAVARGGTGEEAAGIAEAVAARCRNVFVVAGLDHAREGGRLAPAADAGAGGRALPVLELAGGRMQTVTEVESGEAAAGVMAQRILEEVGPLRVGIGHSDRSSSGVADRLEMLVGGADVEVVRYRIGPSVGAHTGPGTAGAVYYPVAPALGGRS